MLCTGVKGESDLVHDHSKFPAAATAGSDYVGYEEPSWDDSSQSVRRPSQPAKGGGRVRSRTPRGGSGADDHSAKDGEGHFTSNKKGKVLCKEGKPGRVFKKGGQLVGEALVAGPHNSQTTTTTTASHRNVCAPADKRSMRSTRVLFLSEDPRAGTMVGRSSANS